MEEQLLEIDSIADQRVSLEDSVGSDAAVIVGGEVPPEQPEDVVGEAAGFAAVNLRDIDDGTPSRTADSVSATAGTPARSMQGLFDSFSQRIVPSWLGWPRGAVRSDPVALRHTQQHPRGGSRSTKSVDRVPDSTDVLVPPRMYETPRNLGLTSQGQIRQEGAYAAPPGNLFSVPLGTAEEATSVGPTMSVPVSVERDFYGRNVVQVPGPIALQSGAGFVGAGQSVPVPTGRTDAAVASAGISAVGPVQPEFLASRLLTELGHSAPNRPIQTGTQGLVFTTTAPLVSVGMGAGVDGWRSASTPVDNSKPGVAGFVPYAITDFVSGGCGPPDFRSAIPSVLVLGGYSSRRISGSGWGTSGCRRISQGNASSNWVTRSGPSRWWCTPSGWTRRRNRHCQ